MEHLNTKYRAAALFAGSACVLAAVTGCSSDETKAPVTSTVVVTSSQTPTSASSAKSSAVPSSAPIVTSTVPMMPNPNGDGSMVPCEGTICTNPNHGAGTDPRDNGGIEMPNPNGDGSAVPCEGTICTNPNHGAGDDAPPEPGQTQMQGPES